VESERIEDKFKQSRIQTQKFAIDPQTDYLLHVLVVSGMITSMFKSAICYGH